MPQSRRMFPAIAVAILALGALTACATSAAADPFTTDSGVKLSAVQLGDPRNIDGTEVCVYGVTAENGSAAAMPVRDMMASMMPGISLNDDQDLGAVLTAEELAEGSVDGYTMPASGFTTEEAADGTSIMWLYAYDCTDLDTVASSRSADADSWTDFAVQR